MTEKHNFAEITHHMKNSGNPENGLKIKKEACNRDRNGDQQVVVNLANTVKQVNLLTVKLTTTVVDPKITDDLTKESQRMLMNA